MQAYDATLEELFRKDMRYVIPYFQRPYVWKKEKQWRPLWDDIRGMAERYLSEAKIQSSLPARAARPPRPPAHFLGAIVTQLPQFTGKETERRRVIDGQQRLTTLSLLLGAMQEVFENFDLPHAEEISRFVMNDIGKIDNQDADHIFKVWPTSMTDQNAFRRTMRNAPIDNEEKSTPIIQAHDFFKRRVEEWIGDDSEAHAQRAGVLQEVVTKLLHLVVIEIGGDVNPHIIFERMNAHGEALLQAELVKNFILDMEEKSGSHDEEAASHLAWLEEKWWRESVSQGRLGRRPRVEIFLNYWMIMRQAAEVRSDRVFPTFCGYADGKSITGIAEDIGRLADIYRKIQDTKDNSVLGRFLYRWKIMNLGVLTPVLMRILSVDSSILPENKLERCLRIIESYLVRRMICGMGTAGYNRLFLDLLNPLDENVIAADEILEKFLASQTAHATLWPDDHRLEEAFLYRRLYRVRGAQKRLRLVLEGIEERLRLRSLKTDDTQVPLGLTIEHIMPQEWKSHWPLPSNSNDPEEERRRDDLIDTIGNLTLVNGKLNPSLSNKPWLDKRKEMEKHTTLFLNKDLIDAASNAGDVWNEEMVKKRSAALAKVAMEVWPHADRI